jgi:hypothetical protein
LHPILESRCDFPPIEVSVLRRVAGDDDAGFVGQDHGLHPVAQNTLPLWIFGAIRLGRQLPEVNAVVTVVILLTLIPVIIAARIAGAGAVGRSAL